MYRGMNIVIKVDNAKRIENAIKEAEGRATERLIDYLDLTYAIREVEKKLDIPKTAMTGIMVDVDYHAQTFARSYKYTPQSTHAIILKTNSGWNLVNVHRDTCRAKKYWLTLTETACRALVARVEKF